MGSEVLIRFRHTGGDVGPFPFPEDAPVEAVRAKLYAEWPREGPLSKEAPGSPSELRLLCAGKFLDAAKSLKDYKKEMASSEPTAVVTMHMLVRPPPPLQPQAKKEQEGGDKPPKAGLCGCSIC